MGGRDTDLMADEIRPYFEPGMSRPMPYLGCQDCLGVARVTEDATGEVVAEVQILSNLVLWWDVLPGGVYFGAARICSTKFARRFVDEFLDVLVEHVTECDGEACGHAGHTMERVACGD
jgi:hypothetical protein